MPLAGIFPIPAVRSYVRRGRPTNSQRRALQQLRGRYVLAIDDISPVPARQSGLPDTTADWRTIFSRTAPLIADIGFGDGRATAALAAAHPECDHVAFEVHPPGVGALMNRLSSQKLQNVRIVQDDVSLMLPLLFTPNALSGVNIFFPTRGKKGVSTNAVWWMTPLSPCWLFIWPAVESSILRPTTLITPKA